MSGDGKTFSKNVQNSSISSIVLDEIEIDFMMKLQKHYIQQALWNGRCNNLRLSNITASQGVIIRRQL